MPPSEAGAGPPVPRYGEASLADLVPSLLSAMGAPGFANPLKIQPLRTACLMVIDGMGFELLRGAASVAPFLAGAAASTPLTSGFPATTAASIASLGTGRPPGEHGFVGYTIWLPGEPGAFNTLRWAPYGTREDGGDALHRLLPEEVQPDTTAFERAAAHGVSIVLIGPASHAHSGMTRAVLRGGRYRPVVSLADTVVQVAVALREPGRRLVYAYHPDLDLIGHMRGTGSEAWRLQLATIDHLVSLLAERLPEGSALVVTGDHGMVDIPASGRIDIDDDAALSAGVRLLSGEARARHVHVVDGAGPDVLAAWRERLGDRVWIASKEQAVAEGWFGPEVNDRVWARIGDVLAAPHQRLGIFQRSVDPAQARMVGHHGSMTPMEQLVPFIFVAR
jgi:hypothetical protein